MMKEYIKKFLYKLVLAEQSAKKLTASFALGVYLAFSPFIGLQTWLVFPLCWLLRLNITVSLATLYVVSNPVTMIPIIISGYMFGEWLLVKCLHITFLTHSPAWVSTFLDFLARHVFDLKKHLGLSICFWCYVVGANILALLVSSVSYLLMKPVFSKLITQLCKKDKDFYEDHCPK